MTITVFGATGGIGRQAVIYALEKGFFVKAYVRNPKKLGIEHPNLSVIVGELNEYSKMRNAIKGCGDLLHRNTNAILLYKQSIIRSP